VALTPGPPRIDVLVVCTGNVCRSPAAELLLAARLGPGVSVASVGTTALVGCAVDPVVAELLAGTGVDAAPFRARQLTAPMVAAATVVLGLTRAHRSAVVELVPSAVRRTFTLREYARLLGAVGPAELVGPDVATRLRESVPRVASLRRRSAAADDDIADPFGRSAQLHQAVFAQIVAAAQGIADVAAPAGRSDELLGNRPDM
jgi:protein-tyrosine phosphatase